jgi:hypothetical protein
VYGDPVTSQTGTLVRPFNLTKLTMPEYEEVWKTDYESLWEDSRDLITESPDARDVIQHVQRTLRDIASLATHGQEL